MSSGDIGRKAMCPCAKPSRSCSKPGQKYQCWAMRRYQRESHRYIESRKPGRPTAEPGLSTNSPHAMAIAYATRDESQTPRAARTSPRSGTRRQRPTKRPRRRSTRRPRQGSTRRSRTVGAELVDSAEWAEASPTADTPPIVIRNSRERRLRTGLQFAVEVHVDLLVVEAGEADDLLALGRRQHVVPDDVLGEVTVDLDGVVIRRPLVGALGRLRARTQQVEPHV